MRRMFKVVPLLAVVGLRPTRIHFRTRVVPVRASLAVGHASQAQAPPIETRYSQQRRRFRLYD